MDAGQRLGSDRRQVLHQRNARRVTVPTLVIRNLTLETVIGVYDWERVATRPLVFDFWLEAAQRFSVNREQIEERLRGWVAECHYQLLEALAEDIAHAIPDARAL